MASSADKFQNHKICSVVPPTNHTAENECTKNGISSSAAASGHSGPKIASNDGTYHGTGRLISQCSILTSIPVSKPQQNGWPLQMKQRKATNIKTKWEKQRQHFCCYGRRHKSLTISFSGEKETNSKTSILRCAILYWPAQPYPDLTIILLTAN